MLLSTLSDIVKNSSPVSGNDIDINKISNRVIEEYKAQKYKSTSFLLALKPRPKPGSLKSLIRNEAKLRKEQELLLLTNDDLRQIWHMFESFSNDPGADEVRVNYDHFSMVLARCKEIYGPLVKNYFKASSFLRFNRDSNGCISANQFLTYLNHRCSVLSMRIELGLFDTNNTGFLSANQLEDFIAAQIPSLTALEEMPASFIPHYKRIAMRKLLFFHGHNGMVKIKDLEGSFVLQELLDLKYLSPYDDNLVSNWFSLQSTQRLYNTFLTYDDDRNGLLSRTEFGGVGNYTMSQFLIQRVFEEHVMKQRSGVAGLSGFSNYNGMSGQRHFRSGYGNPPRDEMDLTTFVDFVLAWENCNHVAAIRYFFPIFDLQNQGYIDQADLYTFFREINAMNVSVMNEYELVIYDVVNEFMDLIKPKEMGKITVEDLMRCGTSGLFFRAFTDVKQFSDYNNREN
mmetsp:Transcript_7778/g.15185  ORF Transcript_7778/g.15185 Transcript_7778/m.15185 type:complete len:456 (-) Transcript_7778:150-1517(-)|eukprot:CAMPEP_0175086760 /NCGR_PEP_ID=MMETSP0052_2-20121109/29440_1 /TAXON_ID=51329 ORGANISM="Polytomella parva, Strain SAG 63-3" /NCGR_SAMPLE_ID=MMETSP0052_2 /ASSEMBLY_ACC=CAM_ASM_000194 /LENGTH=455 /DNA_ID=CAMNT_0016359003 /DNA_START=15 /DNA_END=1382 /DNA_ORIENTATION=+